jgi:hypothetical protein
LALLNERGTTLNAQVDGHLSLVDQNNAIQFAEQANNAQLVSYQKGPAGVVNFATLADVPMGQNIPPLILIEIPIATSPGSVVATQLAIGKHLIFYSQIYVGGVEAKVAGFR